MLKRRSQTNQWKIETVFGDPYFRAILFEAFLDITKDEDLFESLKEYAWDQIYISLNFSKGRALNHKDKVSRLSIEKNKFQMNVNDYFVDKEWNLGSVMGSSAPIIGLNVVGLVTYSYDKLVPTDFQKDPELIALRRSRAFDSEGHIIHQ